MPSHFQSLADGKGIKLEPATSCEPQIDRQSAIVNEQIRQVARNCKARENA